MSSKFGGGAQPTSNLARPADSSQWGSPSPFSGAASQPGPAFPYDAPQIGGVAAPNTSRAQQTNTSDRFATIR